MLFRMVCFLVVVLGSVKRGFEANSDKFRQAKIDFETFVSIKLIFFLSSEMGILIDGQCSFEVTKLENLFLKL